MAHRTNISRETECPGCGRFYPHFRFDECPFCYAQEFLEVEAEDGKCPVCGSEQKFVPSSETIINEIEGLLKG